MSTPPPPPCWILSDGTAGMEAQARGLADAMGLPYQLKAIRPSRLSRAMPTLARLPGIPAVAGGGDRLDPPYPAISISCGKRHAGAAIALKRISGDRVFTIHIQDPRIAPRLFDVLVIPEHDPTRAANVITTTGSLNRIGQALLDAEAAVFASQVSQLPTPCVAVNIGGDTREYRVGRDRAESVSKALASFADRHGCGLLITTSRRTGPEFMAALTRLADRPDTIVWTGDGSNPYLGFLGLADAIVVTSDSINMVSEACSTGKPVYILPIGDAPKRRAAFLDHVRAAGLARPFDGSLESWSYEPLRETERVADMLIARLKASGILV